MTRKIKLFIAQTLDGYIATNEESLDWLFAVDGEGDNGYSDFLADIDTVVMGRRTYDWVMTHENGTYPYSQLKGIIFTNTAFQTPDDVQLVSGSVADWAKGAIAEKGKDIWVIGGGELIRQFLEADLVDELIVTTAPVLLGEGIRLFPPGEYGSKLELLAVKTHGQFAESAYRVRK